MVLVELVEEAQGVGAELLAGELAVMIGVGAGEPVCDWVGRALGRVERLAGRADEDVGEAAAPASRTLMGRLAAVRAVVAAGAGAQHRAEQDQRKASDEGRH